MNTDIAGYNEAREKELPLVQEVDFKVKELRQTIASLNNQQASLRVTLRKLKDNAVELDEKVQLYCLLGHLVVLFALKSVTQIFKKTKNKKNL